MASEQVVVEVNEANELVSVNVITSSSGGTVTSVGIAGTDGIQVDSGSPIVTSGVITLGLSSTVLNQLTLAASALQNITGLVTAGANISISGSGTPGSPYQISGSAGGAFLEIAENLADLASVSTARDNLGLGVSQSVTFSAVTATSGGISAALAPSQISFADSGLITVGNLFPPSPLDQSYDWTLPNATGTLALLSDIVAPEWGDITGTLSDQTDLQTALNAKIGGSTGATDNAILLANGTGGSSAKSAGNSLVMNVTGDLLRVGDDTSGSWLHLGEFTANSGYAAIYFNQSSPSGTNYGFLGDAFGTYLNAVTLVRLGINNAGTLYVDPSGIYGDNNVLNIASGGASQTLRVARTYSSSTNHEAISLFFDSNVGKVGTVAGSGGGTVRDWDLIRGATSHATVGSSGIAINTNLSLQKTITPGGTTGAQVINTQSGTVNFAAGATSLVVTNSLVTTSSIIIPVLRFNDASALIDSVVPASGSFTIHLSSAATAETSVGFIVL